MGTRVGQQVGYHLRQAGRVPGDGHLLFWGGELPEVIRAHGVRVAHRVDDEPRQVDPLTTQRPAGVEASEQHQVLDQGSHPLGLRLHPREHARDLRGDGRGAAPGEFGVAADCRERSAQLVTGVCNEAPQPSLAGLAGL
jgi:hypothetical protein